MLKNSGKVKIKFADGTVKIYPIIEDDDKSTEFLRRTVGFTYGEYDWHPKWMEMLLSLSSKFKPDDKLFKEIKVAATLNWAFRQAKENDTFVLKNENDEVMSYSFVDDEGDVLLNESKMVDAVVAGVKLTEEEALSTAFKVKIIEAIRFDVLQEQFEKAVANEDYETAQKIKEKLDW